MVDSETRHQLSQDVRRLTTGRATNDEFDDAYYESYSHNDDLAIREISRFCWGLYSSDLLLPYRLRGRHAVDNETRKAASRAVLFLQTDLEYEYAEITESFGDFLIGSAWYMGGLVGIAFLVIAGMCFFGGVLDVAGVCLAVGLLILLSCYGLWWLQYVSHEHVRRKFEKAGDSSLWPFTNTSAFGSANENCDLFGYSKP